MNQRLGRWQTRSDKLMRGLEIGGSPAEQGRRTWQPWNTDGKQLGQMANILVTSENPDQKRGKLEPTRFRRVSGGSSPRQDDRPTAR